MRMSTRRHFCAVIGGLTGAAALSPARAALAANERLRRFAELPKAVWVWRTSLNALPTLSDDLARWGVRTVYISVPATDWIVGQTDPARATEGIAQLRAAVGSVYLAGGDPWWSRPDPQDRSTLPKGVERLFDIAQRAGPVAGIALDVEPQTLPMWKQGDRAGLARGYVSLMKNAHAAARSIGVRLCASVHPSHASTPDPDLPDETMFSRTLRHVDHVVTMAYRRNVTLGIRFAAPLIHTLARSSVDWHFGITAQDGPEAEMISYAGVDRDTFRLDMMNLDAQLRASPAGRTFRGIAVHHYAVARDLLS